MKLKLNNSIFNVVIAVLYVAMSLVLGSFAFGIVQFRYSEVLNILCIKDKKYIYGLTLGCFLTNFIGVFMGLNPLGQIDAVLGTLATFIAGLLMYQFRNIYTFKKPILSLLMPAIINGIIIGLELAYFFGSNDFVLSFITFGLGVFISEVIIVLVFGLIIMKPLFNFLEQRK